MRPSAKDTIVLAVDEFLCAEKRTDEFPAAGSFLSNSAFSSSSTIVSAIVRYVSEDNFGTLTGAARDRTAISLPSMRYGLMFFTVLTVTFSPSARSRKCVCSRIERGKADDDNMNVSFAARLAFPCERAMSEMNFKPYR